MEQALLFFDFSKNIEQDVYHNGEQNSSKKAVTLLHGKYSLRNEGKLVIIKSRKL